MKPAPLYALTAALGASILVYGVAFVVAFIVLDLAWLFPILTFCLSAGTGALYSVARLYQGYASAGSIVLGSAVTVALANVFWLQPSASMLGPRAAFYVVSVLVGIVGGYLASLAYRQKATQRRPSSRW